MEFLHKIEQKLAKTYTDIFEDFFCITQKIIKSMKYLMIVFVETSLQKSKNLFFG